MIAMFDPGDRKSFERPAASVWTIDRTGRADAEFAIKMLGSKASRLVPTATAMHFGQWLDWPEWLREGTSLTGTGPLPPKVSLADDLILIGNIIDHANAFALIERVLFAPRPVMGTTGVLTLMHAPNLGLAVQLLLRAMAAQNPFLLIRSEEAGDTARIGFEPPWQMGPLFRFAAIAGIALIYRALESMEPGDLADVTLETRLYDVPEAKSLLSRFKCQVQLTSGAEGLHWPRRWSSTDNPYYDPLLWAMAQSRVSEVERCDGDTTIVRTLRRYIVDKLENERRVPRLKQAAAHLAISTRSIERLLAKHGMQFRTLVDEERRARALPLIADPSISLAETAQRLGFGDNSSFGRSVRRWFGDTPGKLRNAWSSCGARHD